MENEKIKLSDILLIYIDFMADPSEENEKKIKDMLSKIIVREYLPLEQKLKLIAPIVNQAKAEESNYVLTSMNIEVNKVILGLIEGYCVNVENDLNIISIQLSVYDVLYESGFTDWILDHGAKRDYLRFEKMVDNALNFYNLMEVVQTFEQIDPDSFESLNKTIDSFKQELTPEKIDLFKKMLVAGSPQFNEVTEAMAEQVLKEALHSNKIDQYQNTSFSVAHDIEESKKDK